MTSRLIDYKTKNKTPSLKIRLSDSPIFYILYTDIMFPKYPKISTITPY